jgi:uncharacterized membrane protein
MNHREDKVSLFLPMPAGTSERAIKTHEAEPRHPMADAVLHQSFRAGILIKGLHALFETVLGIALLKVSPQTLNRILMSIAAQNLPEDPHDFIAAHLRRAFEHLATKGKHFAAWYLLTHGAAQVAVVIALFRNKMWAYPLLIIMLSVFIAYQMYRFALTHSAAMVVLTVFDLVVIALTWIEYRKQTSGA